MPCETNNVAAACIASALLERGAGKTVCPSEIARRLADNGPDWRDHMGVVHAAVDALLDQGRLSLSWRGVKLARRDGPYRIGQPR